MVFIGATGAVLRRSTFQRTTRWTESVAAVGLPGFHFHDLRHTGNNLAAGTGASLRDLMHRMGHQSTRAALIYQHISEQRDRDIAAGLDEQIAKKRDRHATGTARLSIDVRKSRSRSRSWLTWASYWSG